MNADRAACDNRARWHHRFVGDGPRLEISFAVGGIVAFGGVLVVLAWLPSRAQADPVVGDDLGSRGRRRG